LRLPIQNLPFGRFRTLGDSGWRIGVAIGNQVLDLRTAGLIDHADMHRLMQATRQERQALRQALSEGLREGSPKQSAWAPALLPQSAVELGLPCEVGDYTDFYVGIHHASEIGRQFRPTTRCCPTTNGCPSAITAAPPRCRPAARPSIDPWGSPRRPMRLSPCWHPVRGWTSSWSWAFSLASPTPRACPCP
jgi:fumarylacetoacetase